MKLTVQVDYIIKTLERVGHYLVFLLFLCKKKESKAPVSQLVNAEVNSGNRKAVLASNYTLQLGIRECHAGMKCDLKGTKHYSYCIWLSHDSKYKSYLIRKP